MAFSFIYNSFFYLYFYYYYKLLRKQAYRWIIQGLIFIYTGALVYSLYNIEQLMSPGAQLHTYMYVGVFSMLILGFMYFHSVLQSYNIIYFYRELPFGFLWDRFLLPYTDSNFYIP